MSTPEERITLQNLIELMARDLKGEDTETLLAGLRDAERTADRAIEWSGDIVTALKARMSWSALVSATGLPQTTLHNRMHPPAPKRRADAGE